MHTIFKEHGAIEVKKGKLQHADGTEFFWLADTQWFAMTSRCSIEDFKKIITIRVSQGFTGIQVVVGIPPEVSAWSKNARNAGGWPFNKDHTVNIHYFAEVTKKISIILEAGLVPLIVGGWGHHIDYFGVDLYIAWWKEIVQRYSHLPVLFCLTGEVDLFPDSTYGEKKESLYGSLYFSLPEKVKTFLRRLKAMTNKNQQKHTYSKRLEMWDAVGKWIEKHDQFNRPLTVHPHTQKSSRELFPESSWLTVNAIQSGHSKDSYETMRKKTAQEVQFLLPFINLEPWYEGIFNSFGVEWQEKALQVILDNNAAGMSYGAQGLWNMNTPTDPFLEHWGTTTWQDALKFPGASNLSQLLKKR